MVIHVTGHFCLLRGLDFRGRQWESLIVFSYETVIQSKYYSSHSRTIVSYTYIYVYYIIYALHIHSDTV